MLFGLMPYFKYTHGLVRSLDVQTRANHRRFKTSEPSPNAILFLQLLYFSHQKEPETTAGRLRPSGRRLAYSGRGTLAHDEVHGRRKESLSCWLMR